MSISIISATFNSKILLEITAKSIRSQEIDSIQWIVADGGSTDGTVNWLAENADVVSDWFSEKDEGIYDAWNKALNLVTNEWVIFLGSGDVFANKSVLRDFTEVLNHSFPNHSLVYGKIQYTNTPDGHVVTEVGSPWDELYRKWENLRPALPVHPEVFHHRSLFLGRKFDLRFRIAGDSHFLLRVKSEADPLYVNLPVVKMLSGGLSAKYSNAFVVLNEINMVNKDLGIRPPISVILRAYVVATCKFLGSQLIGDTNCQSVVRIVKSIFRGAR